MATNSKQFNRMEEKVCARKTMKERGKRLEHVEHAGVLDYRSWSELDIPGLDVVQMRNAYRRDRYMEDGYE